MQTCHFTYMSTHLIMNHINTSERRRADTDRSGLLLGAATRVRGIERTSSDDPLPEDTEVPRENTRAAFGT